MAPNLLVAALVVATAAAPAMADCVTDGFAQTLPDFTATAPAPPDPALRPVRPDCLRGLSGPEQENCPREDIASYSAAVEDWVAALNAFVTETNRFANEAALHANAAIDQAQAARTYADEALDFANCEADAINSP